MTNHSNDQAKARKFKRRVLLFSALTMLGSMQPFAATNAASSPQGNTWDSIKQLPNWSGVWVLYMGQKAGGDARGPGAMKLTAEYQKIQSVAATEKHQSNQATCLPSGATAVLQHGVLYEFLFTPGRVTMLFEDGEVRRIFTDGRAHQSLDELSNSFMGDSIGHWEGDTLVVDTIGFPNGELWQNYGVRATKNTHLVERIHLNVDGYIQIDNTMTDPAIFAEPYSYSREYKRSELPIGEPMCVQNNRDTGTEIDLTPPPEDE